jgi:hypothetical protein
MKNTLKWSAQKSEILTSQSGNLDQKADLVALSQVAINPISSLLQTWQRLVKFLANSLVANNEIKVWQKRDRAGNSFWYAYDPMTGETASRTSDVEMLEWIEHRF